MKTTANKKFEVYSDMKLSMVFDQLAVNEREALVTALYKLSGAVDVKMEITLQDGSKITPNMIHLDYVGKDITVVNEEFETVTMEDMEVQQS